MFSKTMKEEEEMLINTSSDEISEEIKFIEYNFDKYVIKIKLTKDNKFLEIVELKIRKDFLSFEQRTRKKFSYDVDKYYLEEESKEDNT